MPRSALIILAAGAATRMGQPKQLLPFRGQPLISHAAETGLRSLCHPVVMVLGAAADEIAPALPSSVIIVRNEHWEQGMGTSIRAGIQAVTPLAVDSAILMLADQPLITAGHINHLVASHQRTGQPIVTAEYAGTVGVPVLFSRALFPELLSLEPGQGCKGLILKHAPRALRIPCPEAEADIDTPADYERLCAAAPSRHPALSHAP